MNIAAGENAGKLITTATNCTFVGLNAGADITEGDGLVIFGDNIRNLDPEKNNDTLFIGSKVAIGKTVFGKPNTLYDILKDILKTIRS